MAWTEREQAVWNDVMNWEQRLADYEGNDFQYTYSKWLNRALMALPEETLESFFTQLDNVLFQIHSLLQSSQLQNEARERIIMSARVFNEEISSIQDLKKLKIDQVRYLNSQHSSRQRLYSLVQGGVTGTGGAVPLSTDLAAIAILNLRAVQITAMTYGYDPQQPFEMMASLKVFHAATLPERLKAEGWQELLMDLEERENPYFYNEQEYLTDPSWLEGTIKQFAKLFAITVFKNKKVSNLPIIGLAIGAGANYRLTKDITEFAEKYYQYRWLQEKKEAAE
ncbi:EcsC family protein [Bacillus thermotolerans]|uniref:Protein ecsC n=1 Tax=Bacillus thermotolerans TaxID=1221996 RepID=A0A0F5HWD1_BACTR|nr:EcsC family protein [Bacillus thermotolerans]KKB37586.1 Protein ecsC [Bacillus thermotolerans]KKB42186.1 Protein ecsC [Bacillus thermotolerans]KKB43285.1 Protein ecsC [Bacillus thermotolerans]